MSARKPFRSQWTRQPEPAPQPVEKAHTKALHLPRPGPGIVITVPLHLLPEYLEIYRLEPAGVLEPKVPPKNGPGQATLLVRRVKESHE